MSRKIEKERHSLSLILLIEIFIVFITAFCFVLFPAINNNHQRNLKDFSHLALNIRDLSYADEFLHEDCINKKSMQINQDIELIRKRLETLLDRYISMGKILSLKTYCEIDKFTYWNNQLQASDTNNTCDLILRVSQIDAWRNELTAKIYNNQTEQSGIIKAIKEYFSNSRMKKYTPSDCHK